MKILYSLFFIMVMGLFSSIYPSSSQYTPNPFSFKIQDLVHGDSTLHYIGDQFFAYEIDGNTGIDYTYRSRTHLYVYNHWGNPLWSIGINNPGGNGGAKHGAADVDGDGQVEIVAIDASNNIKIFQGSNGFLEKTWTLNTLRSEQKAGHIVIVNLRGFGPRDAIVQTVDVTSEGSGINYYVNRSLIALNLETGDTLWQVDQDRNLQDPYEGYWGQGHGPLVCADVDGDGLDEVIGGTVVDDNGDVINLGYYAYTWVHSNQTVGYLDHLDAITVGDFRTDIPGLEWIVAEEDGADGLFFNTVMFSLAQGIIWREMPLELKEQGAFSCSNKLYCMEPQNIAVGNFDVTRPYKEVWNRSRHNGSNGNSQHPWIQNVEGALIGHYRTDQTLGDGFSNGSNSNADGLEMVWTIDWDGGPKEYIAGKARHTKGNVGVFDAMTGTPVWYTGREYDAIRSLFLYVADVSGDYREEVVVCDSTESGVYIRIYHNDSPDQSIQAVNKWGMPLYRHLKQNWNYYSPGSYTRAEDVQLRVRCFLEGAYQTNTKKMRTTLQANQHLPNTAPFSQNPRVIQEIPSDITDWVLLEIEDSQSGEIVVRQSVLLRNDGYCMLQNSDTLRFGIVQGTYHIRINHLNHLSVRTNQPIDLISSQTVQVDFTSGEDQNWKTSHMVWLSENIWGMPGGEANNDSLITIADYIRIKSEQGLTGYTPSDINRDGYVNDTDLTFVISNRNKDGYLP